MKVFPEVRSMLSRVRWLHENEFLLTLFQPEFSASSKPAEVITNLESLEGNQIFRSVFCFCDRVGECRVCWSNMFRTPPPPPPKRNSFLSCNRDVQGSCEQARCPKLLQGGEEPNGLQPERTVPLPFPPLHKCNHARIHTSYGALLV